MTYIQDLFSNLFFLGFFSFATAFLLSIRMYPAIISLVKEKNLMDEPNSRSIHSVKTPTLGGVGLFISFSITITLFAIFVGLGKPDLTKVLALVSTTIILLFLGIKDDLLELAPKKKFIGQLISASIVIFITDVRVLNFEGLLGINEVSYIVSVLFTIFVFLLVINAYNLIDGIDGLAGTIAVISSLSFGIFFMKNQDYMLSLVSFIMIGALVGFLKYNLSKSKKLFMGDSGSLLIGYLLAYQGVSFLSIGNGAISPFPVSNAPILLLTILSFPLLDTLRVFIIRVKQGRSPFSADKNHIHHRLLDLGLKHWQATLLIAFFNVLVIGLGFLVKDFNINMQLGVTVIGGSLLYFSPILYANLRSRRIKTSDKEMMAAMEIIDQSIPISLPIAETADILKKQPKFNNSLHAIDNHNKVSVEEKRNSLMKKIIAKRLSEFKKLTAGYSSKEHRSLKK